MIPLRLEIKGVYSYIEKQVIDFTRLTEAGLFGIFGQVGSGKSTILESIAFALYGEMERYKKSGDDRYYNMLNLRSNEGFIDFTFIAGRNQKVYSIVVKLIRNSKKFEEVKLKDHFYYSVVGAEKQQVDPKVVLDEVGISYDNFKRTVIIPQGQFKEFLELKAKDRTVMLQELFSLSKYDLSPKLSSIEKENNSELDKLRGLMSSLIDITPEAVNMKKEELIKLNASLKNLIEEYTREENILKELNQLENDFNEFNIKSIELENRLKDATLFDEKEKELIEFEKLKSIFGTLIHRRTEASNESTERMSAFNTLEAQLLKAKEVNKINEAEFRRYEKEIITHEELNQKVTRLKKIISAKSKEELLLETQRNISKLEESFNLNITVKRKELTDKSSELESLNESLQNFPLSDTYINDLNEWYLKIEHVTSILNKASEYNNTLEKEHRTLALALTKFLSEQGNLFIENLPDDLSEEEFEKGIEDFRKISENKIREFRGQKINLDVKSKLYEYANHLEDGKPCILCGSVEHPSPLEIEKIDEALLKLSENIEDEELLLKKLSDFKIEALRYFQKIKTSLLNIETSKNELSKSKEELQKVINTLPEGKYNLENKSEFKEAVNKIVESRKLIGDNFSTIKKLKDSLLIINQNAEREGNQINELKNNVIINTAQLDALKAEIPDELWIEKKILSSDTLESEVKKIEEVIKNNNDNFNRYKKLYEDSSKVVTEYSAKVETANKEVQKAAAKLLEIKASLDLALSENNIDELKVISVLEKNLDILKVRKTIEDFKQLKNTLEGELKVLKVKISKKEYIKEEHDNLKKKVIVMYDSLERLKKSTVEMATILERMERDLANKSELQDKFEKLLIRAEDIKTINKLFKGRGFVEFISRKYLNNVVAVANNRFYKMTRQKYKMELSTDAEFIVRDYMNEGKTRLLKSLSGGQTFQAALCLALALSENIQKNAGVNQQFFFLDEGFGTLDKENLQIVFETLKSLRNENRVVGLISHVEELQQDLDVYLKIENDIDKGSLIKESWK
jgi:exonuclease SbcC